MQRWGMTNWDCLKGLKTDVSKYFEEVQKDMELKRINEMKDIVQRELDEARSD